MNTENHLSQAQADELSTFNFINKIDDHIRVLSRLKVPDAASTGSKSDSKKVILLLEIFYDSEKVDNLSFTLHNYTFPEIIDTAKNIRGNEYILQAIDNLLAGEIE